MELIVINTYKHLGAYEKEWSAISAENQNTNPSLEYDFVYNWWRFVGENEKVEIYAVREHKRIIAFFPIQLKKTWFGYIGKFIALDNAHYMDIIARKRDLDRVIMFIFDAIIKQKKSAVFYLHGLVESGGTPVKLSNYLQARNLKEQSIRIVTSYDDSYSYTRNTIFSTNTVRAKTYRNFLWAKEKVSMKGIGRGRK
ncbi:hypothetical protein ACIQYS_13550 [Psychrobacillus sp. NPDC096426]|uniref:hypothetical protein n=1 Tax=Psychrobacillus sp. NPDC096426 TaxID=3364491 RepID=UPI0038267997